MSNALRLAQGGGLIRPNFALRAVPAGPGVVFSEGGLSQPAEPKRKSGMVSFTLSEDSPYGKAGTVVQFSVTPSDTSDQQKEIETYLGGYSQTGAQFMADTLSPVVLVDQEKARRRDFKLENAFEVVETRTGRQGAINEVKHLSETTPYETEEHALSAFIPWAAENESVALYNVKAAHSETIADKLALARCVRVVEKLTDVNSWNPANRTTLTMNFKWNNGSTKAPRLDLHNRIQASAQRIAYVAMNPTVAFHLLKDDDVRKYMVQHMGDAAVDPESALAVEDNDVVMFRLVGFPPIMIFSVKRLPAGGGALEFVLGNDVLLISQPGGTSVPMDGRRIATSYTFRTRGRSGTGWTINEYMPNGRGLEGGTMLEAGYKETDFIASDVSGGLIKDVLG